MKNMMKISCLVMVLVLLSACATSPQKKESGKLTIYTSQPEEDIKQLLEKFQTAYPNIETEFFRSGTEEIIVKLMAEQEKGLRVADVVLIADEVAMRQLKRKEMLAQYEAKELENCSSVVMDTEKYYFGTKIISTGIAYHTENCPMTPTSFQDLLKPEYKDHIIMPSPLYSGAAAYQLSAFLQNEQLGFAYYQGLKDNQVFIGKGNGSVKKAILNGEKSVGFLVDFMALKAKDQGEKIGFVYPTEGVLTITEPVAILQNTDDMESAQKFVEFMLSKTGQEVVANQGYTPIREDVAPLPNRKSIAELQRMIVNTDTILLEREKNKEQFKQLFQE